MRTEDLVSRAPRAAEEPTRRGMSSTRPGHNKVPLGRTNRTAISLERLHLRIERSLTMKHLALLLLIGSLFGLTAGGALANSAPVVIPFETQFDAVNPCTGELTTLSLSGELRIHQFYN